MKIGQLSFAVIGVLFLTGCGGAKLTDEQKAQMKQLTGNMSAVTSAKDSAGPARARAAGDSVDLQTRLHTKMNSPACEMKTPDSPASGIMSLKVDGADCPIAMDFSVTANEAKTEGNVRMYFEIKDAEFLAISDVSKMELAGPVNQGGAELNGYIQSKKYGKVGLKVKASQDKVEVSYSFANFSVNIGIKQGGDGKAQYTLNGNNVTEAELAEVVEGQFAPGMSGTKVSSSSSTSSTSLSYDFTVNGCATGKQTFNSEAAMCEGLQSAALNKSCALDLRKAKFSASSCNGVFVEKP